MEIQDPGEATTTPSPSRHHLTFLGSTGEYFRIWLVNVALTIATLGVYAAWAKVRTRRYFYVSTRLAGSAFEYLAKPKAILIGNVIVVGGFLVYSITQNISPEVSGLIALVFYAVLPWLVWKSLRFRAHNSSYRGIRLRFHGTLGESYLLYLLFPALLAPTLGLLYPYWAFRRRRYLVTNLAYGSTRFEFAGRPGYFYKTYALASLMGVIPAALALFALILFIGAVASRGATPEPDGPAMALAGLLPLLALTVFVFLSALLSEFIYARIWNYTWQTSRLGPVDFDADLAARRLVGIRLTNILAIVASCGLLIPWARVRRSHYVLESLTIRTTEELGGFIGASAPPEGALGDAAADFFDFEIGF